MATFANDTLVCNIVPGVVNVTFKGPGGSRTVGAQSTTNDFSGVYDEAILLADTGVATTIPINEPIAFAPQATVVAESESQSSKSGAHTICVTKLTRSSITNKVKDGKLVFDKT